MAFSLACNDGRSNVSSNIPPIPNSASTSHAKQMDGRTQGRLWLVDQTFSLSIGHSAASVM